MAKLKFLTIKDLWDNALTNIQSPEWLDYKLCSNKDTKILDIEFDIKGDLHFGAIEGIYLDMYLQGDFGHDSVDRLHIGTFKTLCRDDETFKEMAFFMAKFILAARRWMDENEKMLTRKGYLCKESIDSPCGRIVQDKVKALGYKEYGYVVIDLYLQKEI